MTDLNIRAATAADATTILQFITELAIFEKAEHEVLTSVEMIQQTIFSSDAKAHALICENEGQPIGFAVYFYNYSTWLGKYGLYLEDLYVTPAARRTGAGKAIFKALAKIAAANNCGRFEWSVLDWNEPAIKFYQALGAQAKTEWVGYRLTEQQISALANQTE
ncbi:MULTISPECIES: GNAT family N-acetyltransferase [unclassified Arsukibacterium]|uniref:GNAT family N-acetyltransferase n=1 Tax=unclassified Arsukibacterium TaxID=2635278 RepID=UPI000C95C66F|nr:MULTISPECIES: GNAT family N-acetyltransferase [unclassified Arsukibacterium]MAA95490.1 GNAT family N-acetyltransferase [Rheinheimera sp.]HAW92732.1 GNAT family N-acetyltransferase [Candidatus Azambacteria bacterium]|tara:strand:+ start:131 stop:619 length:489 start_codon:yes stop_codon:yes gene_type:complete